MATPVEARFGPAGGDIGRSSECTLLLPDPERRISRKHLQVSCHGDRHAIRLISTNLVCLLNGMPLAPGVEYPLDDDAEIRVGPFVLHARHEAEPVEAPASDDSMFYLGGVNARQERSVFHDLLNPSDDDSPAAFASSEAVDLLVGDTSLQRGPRVAASASADELVASLYAGLGLPVPGPARRSPEQMYLIGALLRSSVDGALGLLASRNISKRALGAGQTLPHARENNALKFSADVDSALERLLGPPQRGFLGPLAAVSAAFDDLRTHEVAVLAGMRAALEAVLDRFSPGEIESRLANKGMWDNLLPVNRKAKLWERYCEQHAEILREVEDDFDALFGVAFLKAYEAQLAQLGRPSASQARQADGP